MSDSTIAVNTQPSVPAFFIGDYQGERYFGAAFQHSSDYAFQTNSAGTWSPALGLWSFTPHEYDGIARMTAYHAKAEWQNLLAEITFGPGLFGRRITINYCWTPSSFGTMRTLDKLATFPTYGTITVGAAETIMPVPPITVPCPFGSVYQADITAPYTPVNRPKFWLQIFHTDVGTPSAGHWVQVTFKGTFRAWGSLLH
jgi:hypothetical protein